MRVLILLILFTNTVSAQFKSYIQYFSKGNYRNSEGDLIIKNNGQLYTVFTKFRNNLDDAAVADLCAKVSTTGGRDWIDLGVVQTNIGGQTTMSVSLVRTSTTKVQMYFCVKNSNTDLRIYRKISNDDCATWSAPMLVINAPGYLAVLNASVVRINSGRIVIPVYFTSNVAAIPPNYCKAYSYYSDDDGATWVKSTPDQNISSGVGYTEPCAVAINYNIVLMMIRNNSGVQHFSVSTDAGATWSVATASQLVSTDSPCKILLTSTGVLIAVHNPPGFTDPRGVLRISKSLDSGATWVTAFDIETPVDSYNFSYASVAEYQGNLLISYWEANFNAGKIAQKFCSIPINKIM